MIFLANFKRKSIVKYPVIKETIIEIIIYGEKNIPLKIKRAISPNSIVGMESKKLNLKAFSGVNPLNNKIDVVKPLLLNPGMIAKP